MAWTIEVPKSAERTLKKLDRLASRRIRDFVDEQLDGTDDPRRQGKPFQAALDRYWAHRVGDYRLISELRDRVLTILILEIGHRSDVYR